MGKISYQSFYSIEPFYKEGKIDLKIMSRSIYNGHSTKEARTHIENPIAAVNLKMRKSSEQWMCPVIAIRPIVC